MKTREYKCYQAWKRKQADPRCSKHHSTIVEHIEHNCNVDQSSILEDDEDEELPKQEPNNDPPAAAEPPAATPLPKLPQNISWLPNAFKCEGERITTMVPSTHEIVHGANKARWKNGCEAYQRAQERMQSTQFQTKDLFSQLLFAIASASVPALALSAAQFLFPSIVMAFFHDAGLFDFADFNADKCVKSFPSDNTLRKHNTHQAA